MTAVTFFLKLSMSGRALKSLALNAAWGVPFSRRFVARELLLDIKKARARRLLRLMLPREVAGLFVSF